MTKGRDLNQLKVRLEEELGAVVRRYCRAAGFGFCITTRCCLKAPPRA